MTLQHAQHGLRRQGLLLPLLLALELPLLLSTGGLLIKTDTAAANSGPHQHTLRRCNETPPAYAELDVRIERAQQIFSEAEAIHGAHGLGLSLPGGAMQVTVGVNFHNELIKKYVPQCGVPPSKPTFTCVQSRTKRSVDGGAHWEMVPVNRTTNRSVSEFNNYAFTLPRTTELIQFTGFQRGGVTPAPANGSAWAKVEMEMIRSGDGGLTQHGTVASVLAPAGLLRAGWISTSHSSIIAIGDKTDPAVLLANAYAPWEGVDGYNEAAKRPKTRVFIIQSTDGGSTWSYLSTVAWDAVNATVAEDHSADCEVNGMCDGFDEATLAVGTAIGYGTSSNTVVCVMRSGGPLYRSVSIDAGLSWSTPVLIAPHGVSPQAVTMSSGVLAVIYGRPDNYVRFSLDGGRTFLPEFCFNQVGVVPYDGGSYDSVIIVPGSPDTLLLTYAVSRTPFDMQVYATCLTT